MKEYIKPEVEILKLDVMESIASFTTPSMNVGEDGDEITDLPW